MKVKRTIALALVALSAFAVMAFTVSTAAFSDSVPATGTVAAGTLFLSVDDNCGLAAPLGAIAPAETTPRTNGATACPALPFSFSITNLVPGGPAASKTFGIENDGTIAGSLTISLGAITFPAGCGIGNWVFTGFGGAAIPLTAGVAPENGGADFVSHTITVALAVTAGNGCQGAALTVPVSIDIVQ